MNIKLLNKIAKCGTAVFDSKYNVGEDIEKADAIMVRSASMLDMEFDKNLLAIARAGAGVNNIPLDRCAEEGIVVFNTPGANANAVKELVITAVLLSSRKIVDGINWVKTLDGTDEIAKAVEKGKSAFVGPEIMGKTIGIIGLGAIGALVANAMAGLGLKVVGYDPYLSVRAALSIDPAVKVVDDINEIFKTSDYITIHIPSTPATKNTINKEVISLMKDNVRIINLARADLVNSADIKDALDSGKVSSYVTDFPNNDLCSYNNVIAIPHLGASTPESEDNCAVMAAEELVEFLEKGNVKNSVNYPAVSLPVTGLKRFTVLYHDVENALAKISEATSAKSIASGIKKGFGYAIVETDKDLDLSLIEGLDFVIKVRKI